MNDQVQETEDEKADRAKRLRQKNIVLGLALVGFIVLLYMVSYVRITSL
ncbi:hypothetical protein [Curvivirga sp.]